ncbi:ribosome assembly RNA-binding protein YhbY [Phosphitispora sp. TUW77]|uniref:ribosome assembly RNA-binding protein YhbY n=1 Tax=Phosphitispora sp. TUW77 TaxID=3152361 RepID=UPI003AB1B635
MARQETDLTGKQKRYLRGLGSTIDPVIQIGKGGVVPGVIKQADDALEARELVKARVLNNCLEDTKQVAGVLSRETGAALVQVIGHTFLIYRTSSENPKIKLP